MSAQKKYLFTSCLFLLALFFSVTGHAQQNVLDSLVHQSFQRKYIVHLPPDYSSAVSVPIVIVLHGGSGNFQNVQGFTEMNFVSNQNGFIAVYPQGQGVAPPGYSWADGRGTTADNTNIDDVGFMVKLIDQLVDDYNIDPDRVYLCGFSNGGFMTQRLACEVPEKFAAIGALGCSLDTNLIQSCTPSQSVPMAYFFGTADPEVPYEGGAMNNPAVTPVVAVDTAVQFWVKQNKCQTMEPLVRYPDLVPTDNSTVELYRYTDCDCLADVYFYKVINGGHTWPGVPLTQFPQLGNTNEDLHASYELWDFFTQFSRCGTVTNLSHPSVRNGLWAYPNPTSAQLFFKSSLPITMVMVYDLSGRLLFRTSEQEINLQSLSAGPYVLRVFFRNGRTQTIRVQKE